MHTKIPCIQHGVYSELLVERLAKRYLRLAFLISNAVLTIPKRPSIMSRAVFTVSSIENLSTKRETDGSWLPSYIN